jgi:ABC-type Fe3+-hydroxamate transport system substrate-binding protein
MLKLTRNWLLLPVLAAFCCTAGIAGAAETVQEWEVIVPTGEIEKSVIEPAPRINSLEGKTVVLRWNGKNNGNLFLDRLAVLMEKNYPKTKVIKSYTDSNLNTITGSQAQSMFVTNAITAMKPDLVIAAQAD